MMRSNMKKQMSGAPKKSMRPKMRPEMIGNTPGSQGTRGIDPMENYGAEGVKRLTGGMKNGGKVKKMMGGGMAKSGYKSGGKVRGCGMARGGAVRACKMVKMKGS